MVIRWFRSFLTAPPATICRPSGPGGGSSGLLTRKIKLLPLCRALPGALLYTSPGARPHGAPPATISMPVWQTQECTCLVNRLMRVQLPRPAPFPFMAP